MPGSTDISIQHGNETGAFDDLAHTLEEWIAENEDSAQEEDLADASALAEALLNLSR
jgi:hypothetical protein